MTKPTARLKFMVKSVTTYADGSCSVSVDRRDYGAPTDGASLLADSSFVDGHMTIRFDDASQADRFKVGAEFNVDITPA
jgi:hypothetical protein